MKMNVVDEFRAKFFLVMFKEKSVRPVNILQDQ